MEVEKVGAGSRARARVRSRVGTRAKAQAWGWGCGQVRGEGEDGSVDDPKGEGEGNMLKKERATQECVGGGDIQGTSRTSHVGGVSVGARACSCTGAGYVSLA